MLTNIFSYSDRDIGFESDNLINYNAGPIDIELNLYDNMIIIKTTNDWKDLMIHIKPILIEAWCCDEKNIIIHSDCEYRINFDFDILKKYLETNILLN